MREQVADIGPVNLFTGGAHGYDGFDVARTTPLDVGAVGRDSCR